MCNRTSTLHEYRRMLFNDDQLFLTHTHTHSATQLWPLCVCDWITLASMAAMTMKITFSHLFMKTMQNAHKRYKNTHSQSTNTVFKQYHRSTHNTWIGTFARSRSASLSVSMDLWIHWKNGNQVFHHSQVISVRPTSVKPMWYYNGRNQFIPMKISFTTNSIGMIRMQMKRITSKCSCSSLTIMMIFCNSNYSQQRVIWQIQEELFAFVHYFFFFKFILYHVPHHDDYLLNKIFNFTCNDISLIISVFALFTCSCSIHVSMVCVVVLAVCNCVMEMALSIEFACSMFGIINVDASQILKHINWRVCIRTHCITYGWQLDLSAAKVQRLHRFQYERNNTVSYHITFTISYRIQSGMNDFFWGRASSLELGSG